MDAQQEAKSRLVALMEECWGSYIKADLADIERREREHEKLLDVVVLAPISRESLAWWRNHG